MGECEKPQDISKIAKLKREHGRGRWDVSQPDRQGDPERGLHGADWREGGAKCRMGDRV